MQKKHGEQPPGSHSAITASPRCSGKTGTWRNAALSSTSHPAKSCPVSFRKTRKMAMSCSTDGTSSFSLMKLEAFPAEPVNDPSSTGLVLSLLSDGEPGHGYPCRCAQESCDFVFSSKSSCTHFLAHVEHCGVPQFFAMFLEVHCFAAAPDLLNDSLPQ